MADWSFLYRQTQQRLKKRVAEIAKENHISSNLVLKIWSEILIFKNEENNYYGDACAMTEEAPPVKKKHPNRVKV